MNIKAVARRAGVSTATVSRTINNSTKVSPDTARRVHRAIEALNFIPNTNARSLGSGRSNLLGLIISDITNPFFPEMVKAFEDIAIAEGQEVLIGNTNYDPERTVHCVTRMLQRKVDGVAIMTSEMDDHLIGLLQRKEVPVVFFDNFTPSPGVTTVHVDYAAGVDMAMKHLTALGHSRIAFISGPLRLASAGLRYRSFVEYRDGSHLSANPLYLQEGNHRHDGGYEAMRRILQSRIRPTAVVASNDLTAIGALGAIADAGLSVPADISVIGFDDIQLSAYTSPPLTTIRVPHPEIARSTVRALLNTRAAAGVKQLPQGESIVIAPYFLERRSTGPAPGK